MKSELLFKIYSNARKINHSQVVLPNIKPEYRIIETKPIRNHYNHHSFG